MRRHVTCSIIAMSFSLLIFACKSPQSASGLAEAELPARRDIRIISDIDDTVKITNVEDNLNKIYNGLFGKDIFAGTVELYVGLLQQSTIPETSNDSRLSFLSGSPSFLQKKVTNLLKSKGMPAAQFYLRTQWRKIDTATHKRQALPTIVNSAKGGGFVLFGDDTEHDPEVYADFAKTPAGAERVYAIYIRRINGRTIPQAAVPYYTVFDVAVAENKAGRLTNQQVVNLANVVIATGNSNPKLLFPNYVICPTTLSYPTSANDPLAEAKQKVASTVNALCAQRRGNSEAAQAYQKFLETKATEENTMESASEAE